MPKPCQFHTVNINTPEQKTLLPKLVVFEVTKNRQTGRQAVYMLLLTSCQEELNDYNLIARIERNVELEVDKISLNKEMATGITLVSSQTHTHTHSLRLALQ